MEEYLDDDFDMIVVKYVLQPKSLWVEEGRQKEIEIDYTVDQDAVGSKNWIGMYRVTTDNQEESLDYWTYQWTGGKDKGTVSYAIPPVHGSYKFKLWLQNDSGDICVASSDTVIVGPRYEIKPIAPEDGSMPAKIKVVVTQTSAVLRDFDKNSWLGEYKKSTAPLVNKQYETFAWVINSKLIEKKTAEDQETKTETFVTVREIEFDITKAGLYEFRMFRDKSYYDVASAGLRVTEGQDAVKLTLDGLQIKIDFTINSMTSLDKPWIGVYHVEEQSLRQWRRYRYVTAPGSSSITFKAPIHTGTYEARLFGYHTYQVIAKSNPITIQGI